MGYVIAVVNQKGGSGKSKTVGGLTSELAALGRRVLVIDADPQGTVTRWMLGESTRSGLLGLAEVLDSENTQRPISIKQLVRRSETFEGVDVLGSDYDRLSGIESQMTQDPTRSINLLASLQRLDDSDYDYVIIDTPGTLGQLTMSAVMACEGVLIPIDSDSEAVNGFSRLLSALERMKKMKFEFEVLGIVSTRFRANTIYSTTMLQVVKEQTDYPIYATIRESVRISELNSAGQTVGSYAKNEPAHQDFTNLAIAVDTYVKKNENATTSQTKFEGAAA